MSEPTSSENDAPTEKKSPVRVLVLLGLVVVLGVVSLIVNIGMQNPAQPGSGPAPGGDSPTAVPEEPDIVEHEGYTLLKDERNAYYDVTDALVDPTLYFGNTTRASTLSLQNVGVTDIETADEELMPEAPVIVVKIGDETRFYPLHYLGYMPVINDTVAGQPILIHLSGVNRLIGGVYNRQIGDHVHTFGLTSHRIKDRNYDNENESYLLWDVETESIWFPLIGKAITGQMKGTRLKYLDEDLWGFTSWADAKRRYPDAKVIESVTNPTESQFVRPTHTDPGAASRTFVKHDAEDARPAVLDTESDATPEAEIILAPDYNANRTLPE